MGTWPENKLLLSMSVPIMISMLVQALYNVVDTYFVSLYAQTDGNAALGLAFPVQNLMIAVAVGSGVGVNALLSRSLGEKNFEKANKIAMQGVVLAFACYLLFLVVGLVGTAPIIHAQSTQQAVVDYAIQYLRICCVLSFGVFMQVIMERLLQATGRTVLSMVTQGAGAITNIILDPIMIFGLLGCPELGVAGAAYATVIGQMVAGLVGLLCNLLWNKDIILRLKNLIPDVRLLGQILFIGVPSIIMSSIGSVMTFSMNKILEPFVNGIGVAVFGVYFKLQSFVFMPVFGLNNGMVPIIAYNLGAKKRSRIIKTIKLSAIYASSIMAVGLLLFQALPQVLLGFFQADEATLQVGVPAFRIISLCFVFAGVSIVISSVCQAVGKSIYSMLVSIGRQLVVLVPAAFLLSLTGNVDRIWWAFPIAEVLSLFLCLLFLRQVLRKLDF
ncbi:MAG: MATE family efflux transporter [Clostridia bacterium]|nr:MATE family efflux transporter [Clostridia bacterium]